MSNNFKAVIKLAISSKILIKKKIFINQNYPKLNYLQLSIKKFFSKINNSKVTDILTNIQFFQKFFFK